MYYLRTKPAVNAIQFTVDMQKMNKQKADDSIYDTNKKTDNSLVKDICTMEEGCLSCSG